MKRTFLFATIASILSINAYAVSATVTSKDYVDTTRQATIPASGTNSETPGDTVVTYTDTAGTIGERGICSSDAYDDGDCGDNELVTTDVIYDVLDYVDEQLNLPETTVTYKTCYEWSGTPHTDENCLLWDLSNKNVFGYQCNSSAECTDWGNQHNCQYGVTCMGNNRCECQGRE